MADVFDVYDTRDDSRRVDSNSICVGPLVLVRLPVAFVQKINLYLAFAVILLSVFVAGLELGYSIHPTKVLYHESKKANQEIIQKALQSMQKSDGGNGEINSFRDG